MGIFGTLVKSRAIACLALVFSACVAISFSYEDIAATLPDEKVLLETFKRIALPLIPESSYVYKFAKDDLYLMKWLQVSRMDIRDAKEKLVDHLKWRESENIDDIDKEDWTEMYKEFPMNLGSFDKEGRPVAEKLVGDWNVQQGILDGKSEIMHRYFVFHLEMLQRQLYESRAAGKNVTGVIMLDDVEGFSFSKQACPLCLPFFYDWPYTADKHYPRIIHNLYLLNAAKPFYFLWRATLPFTSSATANSMRILPLREQWLPVLENLIDSSERGVRFGGTR